MLSVLLFNIIAYVQVFLLVDSHNFLQIRAADIWRDSQDEDLQHRLLDYHMRITVEGLGINPPPLPHIMFEGCTDYSQLELEFDMGKKGTCHKRL